MNKASGKKWLIAASRSQLPYYSIEKKKSLRALDFVLAAGERGSAGFSSEVCRRRSFSSRRDESGMAGQRRLSI